jgi:hypothetical protein
MEIKSLSPADISRAITLVQQNLAANTALYISSSDHFLSEYVPLADCLRYYVTGFTGSTAEVLVTATEIFLFVDGRYHQQAEQEQHELVTVEKVPFGTNLESAMLEKLSALQIEKVQLVAQRTPYQLYEKLVPNYNLEFYDIDQLNSEIGYSFNPTYRTPYLLKQQQCGESSREKLQRLFTGNSSAAYLLCATDQVSWITNLRGFHAPYQSFIQAKALVTAEHIYLFNSGGFSLGAQETQDGNVDIYKYTRTIYRREVRTVKKSSGIRSHKDAQGFRFPDGRKPRAKLIDARIFHYGWARDEMIMQKKINSFDKLFNGEQGQDSREFKYKRVFGLKKFQGTHPALMSQWIEEHRNDLTIESMESDFHLKHIGMAISDLIERLTGYRMGEFKNYELVD